MRRHASRLIAVFLLLGAWQAGQGGYIHAKAWLAQQLLASAWQRTLAGGREVRPWPWADTWPVARLRVPRLGVDLIVLRDVSGESLAFGPGFLPVSNVPGQEGVTVLSGHRDTHFAFTRHLARDEVIELQDRLGTWQRYRLSQARVVDSRRGFLVASGLEALVLSTCYPLDAVIPGGHQRLVVVFEPLDAQDPDTGRTRSAAVLARARQSSVSSP